MDRLRERWLSRAVVFTFLAHGAAMLLMAAILLAFVPGGTTASDAERMAHIAASPVMYRLGWMGWQITAASDVVLAVTLFRATGSRFQLVFILLAVIPDQYAQAMLVTRGVELARAGDLAAFLAFEDSMFPLTSGWAAVLYTIGAIGWAVALRSSGRWSRVLEYLSPPMLLLFVAISLAPILPVAIRPSAVLIGQGNAVAFTVLEAWFVAVFMALRKRTSSPASSPSRRT